MKINISNFDRAETPDAFFADASDLGWAPGYWPMAFSLVVSGDVEHRMIATSQEVHGLVRYANTACTIRITVFND